MLRDMYICSPDRRPEIRFRVEVGNFRRGKCCYVLRKVSFCMRGFCDFGGGGFCLGWGWGNG